MRINQSHLKRIPQFMEGVQMSQGSWGSCKARPVAFESDLIRRVCTCGSV